MPKFDLDVWNPEYFTRLADFCEKARARGIIVQLSFFCHPYTEEQWVQTTFHPDNNVNGVGEEIDCFVEFMTEKDGTVWNQQVRLVEKLVQALNGFENVYFEICNEPGNFRDFTEETALATAKWQRGLAAYVKRLERSLPNKHLVAVNPHTDLPVSGQADDDVRHLDDYLYADDPNIDILHYHYIGNRNPVEGLTFKRIEDKHYRSGNVVEFLNRRREWNKPITFDETYGGIVHFAPPRPDQNRIEGWETLFAGGSGYDHLDWSYTTHDPLGKGTPHPDLPDKMKPEWLDGTLLRRYFANLASFARSLPLTDMEPSGEAEIEPDETVRGFVLRRRNGSRVAVYVVDVRPPHGDFATSKIEATVRLSGLKGTFSVRLFDPKSGRYLWQSDVTAAENRTISVEVHNLDQDVVLDLWQIKRG